MVTGYHRKSFSNVTVYPNYIITQIYKLIITQILYHVSIFFPLHFSQKFEYLNENVYGYNVNYKKVF